MNADAQSIASILLGRAHPGPVSDAWWQNEYELRLRTLTGAVPELRDYGVDPIALARVLGHPTVGLRARAASAESANHWAPVTAALRLHADGVDAAIDELRSTEKWADRVVHLPGTGLVCDMSTGTIRSLPIVGGIEVNGRDHDLTSWSDHVDVDPTADWVALVTEGLAFVGELDEPEFADATSLTTVVVPLQQRDGGIVGRSRYEIESGSVADAVGAVFLSPGDGDRVYFAEALVHESYHHLLNAAVHIVAFELKNDQMLCSPWKPMPRPVLALLHGIVAFSSVMRFWRRVSEVRADWSSFADQLVARRAREILDASTTLLEAEVLTAAGSELVVAAASDARGVV